MSKNVALGIVIGGAVASSFGRAIGDTTRGLDSLKSRAEKARGLQGLIGETIRLRKEMTATAQSGGAGLQRLHDAHERNIASLRAHGVAVGQLSREYERMERTARSVALMERGREQIGAGMAQVRQGLQVGGAVAATAAAPTMVAANYQAIIRDIAIKGGIAGSGEEKALADTIRAAALDNGMERNQLAEAVNQLVAGGMEIKDAQGFAALIAKFAVGQNAAAPDVAAMVLALKQAGVSDAAAMEQALGKIAVAGDLGSFEAKDMAKHFAALMPQLTGYGMSGEHATVALANMLQTQMKAAGNADEAANNLKNLLSKITAEDTVKKFEGQGIDYGASMQAAIAKGYDPVSAFIGLIEQSMQRTDPAKAQQLAELKERIAKTEDPVKAQQMLDGYLAMAGLSGYISDQQAKQAALAAIQNKDLHQANLQAIQSADGLAKIEKDLALRREASQNKWKEAGEKFNDALLSIGDAIRPITDLAADGIARGALAISGLVEKFPLLASGALGVGAAVAGSLALIGTARAAAGAVNVGRAVLGLGRRGRRGAGDSPLGAAMDALGGAAGGAGGAQAVFVTNWPGGGMGGVLDTATGRASPSGRAGRGVRGRLGGAVDLLGRHGGKLGGALAIGATVAGLYNMATGDGTPAEKAEGYGGAAGGLAGGLAGAKAGALLGAMAGPLGAALGGVVGGALGSFGGDALGGWFGKRLFGGGASEVPVATSTRGAAPAMPAPAPLALERPIASAAPAKVEGRAQAGAQLGTALAAAGPQHELVGSAQRANRRRRAGAGRDEEGSGSPIEQAELLDLAKTVADAAGGQGDSPAPQQITFAPTLSVTVQGDVKDPQQLAGELMPHLQRMFEEFRAQQQRGEMFDAAHV